MILNYCGVRGQKAVDFLADVLGDSVLSLGEAKERGIRKLFSANAYILTVPLYGGLSCIVLDDIKSTVFCGSKMLRETECSSTGGWLGFCKDALASRLTA